MHPWHDIALGDSIDVAFPAVIETPRESHVQYALDLDTGLLRVRRVLFSAMQFPANYGFVPQTLGGDAEPIDVLALGQESLAPMSLLRVRAIGLLRFKQAGKRDDKLVAVHVDDPVFAHYRHIEQLPAYRLAQLERFFEDYRALEHVEAETAGFEGPDEALAILRAANARYSARDGGPGKFSRKGSAN